MRLMKLGASLGTNQTLADVVLPRVGNDPVAASQVFNFVAIYALFLEHTGREPRSLNELASGGSSRRSRATIERWGQKFRDAFPEYAMPTVLWAIAQEQIESRDESTMTLLLPAVRT